MVVPSSLDHKSNDEGGEIGVSERCKPHHSPVSVASLPAPPEPMSGTRYQPTPVEESPAPLYLVVEKLLVPQCLLMEESPAPMGGLNDCVCLAVDSAQEHGW